MIDCWPFLRSTFPPNHLSLHALRSPPHPVAQYIVQHTRDPTTTHPITRYPRPPPASQRT